MRIGFVAAGGFDQSGRERVIPALLWLVERLARRHDVHVFVLRHYAAPRSYPLLGATIHDSGRPRGPIAQWRALQGAMHATGRFDVVHGYWAVPAGLAAAVVARRLNVPSIVTLDSGELVSLPAIQYGLQRTWRSWASVALACRLAARVTVCSEYMQDIARLRDLDVEVIPLGVDPGAFTRGQRPPEGPPWRLLQVASLNRVKNQAALVDALARLRARGTNVELDLVGEDTLDGAIAAHAAALGVAAAVRCHGFQPTDWLPPFYHRAHLYVQSSLHEAAGVAVLEAAAVGLPVMGTAVGYVRDGDGVRTTGVPEGHPDVLAEAIDLLLQSPERRRRLADAARIWALVHDADWSANRFERIYTTRATRG